MADWNGVIEWFGKVSVGDAAAAITALAALWTILVTIRGRKAERKAILRRELLDWATKINVFAIRHRTEAIEHILVYPMRVQELIEEQIFESLFETLEPVRSSELYAEHIGKILGPKVYIGVLDLNTQVRKQIKALHHIRRRWPKRGPWNIQKLLTAIASNNSRIHAKAADLINLIGESTKRDL